jgi:Zn-dependent protease with chaperone function
MSLFLFLLVICSLACGGIPSADSIDFLPHLPLMPRGIAACGLVTFFAVLAWRWTLPESRQLGAGGDLAMVGRGLEKKLDRLRWVGLLVAIATLVLIPLAEATLWSDRMAGSIFLQILYLLTPGLLTLAITLAIELRFTPTSNADRECRSESGGGLAADDAERGGDRLELPSAAQTLRALPIAVLRFAGWMIAPMLIMAAASDLLGKALLATGDWAEAIPQGAAGLFAVAILMPILVPWLAKRVWKTRPLSEPQYRWLVELTRRLGGSGLDVRLWDTGMRETNAAVVGFFPHARSLLLTDRLLRDASADQLYLIALHELAHLRRGHMWLRMLAVAPPWLAAAAWVRFVDAGPLSFLVSHLLAIIATLGLLRLVAHATEYDADRVACDLAAQMAASHPVGRGEGSDGAIGWGMAREQVERFCTTLRQANGDDELSTCTTTSWLHPSVEARCRALRGWVAMAQSVTGPAETPPPRMPHLLAERAEPSGVRG